MGGHFFNENASVRHLAGLPFRRPVLSRPPPFELGRRGGAVALVVE